MFSSRVKSEQLLNHDESFILLEVVFIQCETNKTGNRDHDMDIFCLQRNAKIILIALLVLLSNCIKMHSKFYSNRSL